MVVVGNRTGQLGNRIFVFAHLIANAMEYGYEVQNLGFYSYAHYFTGTRDDFFCRFPPGRSLLRGVFLQGVCSKLVSKLLLPLSGNSVISGILGTRVFDATGALDTNGDYDMNNREYTDQAVSTPRLIIRDVWPFRDYRSLAKHADAVRSFFTPVEKHARSVSELVSAARQGCDLLVGIHIRQGDYKGWQGGKYFYSTGEYAGIMQRIRETMPGKRIRFLVCSNEKQDETLFAGLDYIMGTDHPIEDMYAFAKCDYLAGPPSTFSAWASFYGSVPLCFFVTPADPVDMDRFQISNG